MSPAHLAWSTLCTSLARGFPEYLSLCQGSGSETRSAFHKNKECKSTTECGKLCGVNKRTLDAESKGCTPSHSGCDVACGPMPHERPTHIFISKKQKGLTQNSTDADNSDPHPHPSPAARYTIFETNSLQESSPHHQSSAKRPILP